MSRDGAECLEHLAGADAVGHLQCAVRVRAAPPQRSQRAAWTSLCWRTSSDSAWKPNVSTCQRSDWTSPYATRSMRRHQRGLELDDLLEQLRRRRIACPQAVRRRPGDGASGAAVRPCSRSAADRAQRGSGARASAVGARRGRAGRLEPGCQAGSSPSSGRTGATVCMSRVATASRPRRTWSAPMAAAWRVVSAVTRGWPSRSEPIHDPQRRKAGRPAAGCPCGRCRWRVRALRRRAARRDPWGLVEGAVERPVEARRDDEERLSKKSSALRTSSSGVGRSMRSTEVRHSSEISSRRRRRISASSAA